MEQQRRNAKLNGAAAACSFLPLNWLDLSSLAPEQRHVWDLLLLADVSEGVRERERGLRWVRCLGLGGRQELGGVSKQRVAWWSGARAASALGSRKLLTLATWIPTPPCLR